MWVAPALAGAPVSAPTVHALNERFPTTIGAKVEEAFPGFLAVSKGQEVFFIRDDFSVLIPGDVIDLKTNASLVQTIRTAHRPKISPTEFNTADAIQFGKGTHRLYVFSDPDCPFCRRLQGELDKLTDVQIFLFPYPLTSLHPNAASASEAIWCQSDRASAWRAYTETHLSPPPAHCANPLERNVALGEHLQILGTPALVFEDGTVVPGAVSAERIQAQLVASSHKAVDRQ
jgi:thiol:disulfide interchange protein DsbC